MKHLVFLLFSLITFRDVRSQNLVQNPSFEDTLLCNNNPPQFWLRCNFWSLPTFGSSDCFNTSGYCIEPIPQNAVGFQYPRSGNGYAGFATLVPGSINPYREYLQNELLLPLDSGHKYCLEFYVSCGDKEGYASGNLGAYFSDTIFQVQSGGLLNFVPQIKSPQGLIYDDTINWVKISGELIANGGEQYLIIGNFDPDSLTSFQPMPGNTPGAYYYIDDVALVDCTSVSIAEILKSDDIKLYPNPVKDILYLQVKGGINCSRVISSPPLVSAPTGIRSGIYYIFYFSILCVVCVPSTNH